MMLVFGYSDSVFGSRDGLGCAVPFKEARTVGEHCQAPQQQHSSSCFAKTITKLRIPTMNRTVTAAAVLYIIGITGLMVGVTMVESAISEPYGSHEQVHSRRSLLGASATPLSAFNSASMCGGPGPVCPDGVHIECVVGGIVGCICALVRTCQPTVSGCTLFDGASVTSCGF